MIWKATLGLRKVIVSEKPSESWGGHARFRASLDSHLPSALRVAGVAPGRSPPSTRESCLILTSRSLFKSHLCHLEGREEMDKSPKDPLCLTVHLVVKIQCDTDQASSESDKDTK